MAALPRAMAIDGQSGFVLAVIPLQNLHKDERMTAD